MSGCGNPHRAAWPARTMYESRGCACQRFGTEILQPRHVADRRVEPDVEIFPRGIRNLEAEIGSVTRDVPVLEPGVEPLGELVCHFRLYMAHLGDVRVQPFAQPGLKIAELEEIMLRVFLHRRHAGEYRDRIFQISR